jgi:hypothetical protein
MPDKTFAQLTVNDKRVLAKMLPWQGKELRDCSKGELIDCIIHLTMKVALYQDALDKFVIPFYKRPYWLNRFYWRGNSWFEIANTFLSFLCNRVIVREIEKTDAGIRTVGYSLKKGTDFPRSKK